MVIFVRNADVIWIREKKCDCKEEEKMREERIARSVENLSHLICTENNGQMRIIV